jgi:hypothetical protein
MTIYVILVLAGFVGGFMSAVYMMLGLCARAGHVIPETTEPAGATDEPEEIFTGHCLNGEHAGCPKGEYDELGDYGQGFGDWTPCGCSCHKKKPSLGRKNS